MQTIFTLLKLTMQKCKSGSPRIWDLAFTPMQGHFWDSYKTFIEYNDLADL